MHFQLFFLLSAIVLISAVPLSPKPRIIDPTEKDPLRIKWLLWTDDNGNIHNESLLLEPQKLDFDVQDILQIMLYTKDNPYNYELIDPYNMDTLIQSIFYNPKRPNVFIIHGWNNDYSSNVNVFIRDALLENEDVNVFVVNWGEIAHKFYTTAKAAVPGVGVEVGFFVQSMMDIFRLSSDDVTLIGHSLGAHAAGAAGASMFTKPHAIIGLDPAGPLFDLDDLDKRIDESDAKYVQIIHTCGGFLGFRSSLGNTDYFPNGGSKQPGCGLDLLGTCAHGRSYQYFAESIHTCGFHAVQCTSHDDYEDGKCDYNNKSYLGCYDVDKNAAGDYFLKTNDEEPFVIES